MASTHDTRRLVLAMALGGTALLAANRWVLPALLDLRPIRDGVETYASDDARLRSVVWEAPVPLLGELDGPGEESHARVSPDGRWLVFAAGVPGGGSELYLAELIGGVPQAPRALAELNSAADDVAPAWSVDALHFASDRAGGAGALDLYRASWDGASFGAVEPLAAVNTAANETEPAPSAGALYFASDRLGAGFDLFVELAADGARRVERVDELSGHFDERDPFVTPDGRALYFASNRHLGGADFDLHRSFRDGGRWLEPERLAGLHSPASERAPATTPDGLTLLFVRAHDAGSQLVASRSIELFRGAAPARGWADLLLMAALLLLAAVAALSRRREGLDLLYKCALASVLAHLAILALLRYLYPEAELWSREAEREPRIRVRLEAPRELRRGLVERGGDLEARPEARVAASAPGPLELSRAELSDAAPATQQLAARESPSIDGPQARELPLERASEPVLAAALTLAGPDEAVERRRIEEPVGAAPSPSETTSVRSRRNSNEPIPAELARTEAPVSSPAPLPLARRAETARLDAAPTARATSESIERASAPDALDAGPTVSLPSERRTVREASASAVQPEAARQFDPVRATAADGDTDSAPARAAIASEARESAGSASPKPAQLAQRAAPEARATTAWVPSDVAPSAAPGAVASAPELTLPSESRSIARSTTPASERTDVPEPAGIAVRRESSAVSGPSGLSSLRPSATSQSGRDLSAPPAAAPLAIAPPAAVDDLPQAPRRLDDTPYRSRFGIDKEIALREHGGSEQTERAVASGLRYLAARQRRDGSWGSRDDRSTKYRDVRVGKTGLALLAFLGAGHTPGSESEHALVADRAVRWLCAQQDPATGHFGDCEAYGHGIATYALAECYALTRDERLGQAVRLGVRRILEQQVLRGERRNIGGWSYFYADGALFDRWPRASITAWQVMALESARLGGVEVPDESFARAREFLRGAWDDELGRFRYSHDPARLRSGYATLPGSTPAALFALSLLGEDLAAPQWDEALGFVAACAPDGYRWEGDEAFVARASGNLYFWYYGSLALFRRGGGAWERWNVALKESLPPAQDDDGSWRPLDTYAEYAGDDDGDRVYSTAMCVLSLEVYYRYFTPLLRVR